MRPTILVLVASHWDSMDNPNVVIYAVQVDCRIETSCLTFQAVLPRWGIQRHASRTETCSKNNGLRDESTKCCNISVTCADSRLTILVKATTSVKTFDLTKVLLIML